MSDYRNLNLCLAHKQEWKQSHYAEQNCDHCKLQRKYDELLAAVNDFIQATGGSGNAFGAKARLVQAAAKLGDPS